MIVVRRLLQPARNLSSPKRKISMSLPWLDQPVLLHSSRDAGMCSMTPEQCALKTSYWVFWYEADHRYGLPTIAFFLTAILIVAIGNLASTYAPERIRRNSSWLRFLSFGRFISYKSWRLRSWNTQSLAAYILGAAGAVFFLGNPSDFPIRTKEFL